MDIDKCKILLEVVECGSLSAAAHKLGYTTAGISYNVDAVESELGFPVFRRGHDGISLTRNGARILPTLRELIRVDRELEERACALRQEIHGEVRIAVQSGGARALLPNVMQRFRKEFPDVSLRISEEPFDQSEASEADFCIRGFRESHSDSDSWIPLLEDWLICVVPQDHPLAQKPCLHPEDLQGQSIIMPASGWNPEAWTIVERYGLQSDIKFTTAETDTAFAMVEHGFGIAIANRREAPNRRKGAVIVPFDPPQTMTEGIAVRSYADASPLVKCVMDYLLDYFRALKEKEENGKSAGHEPVVRR